MNYTASQIARICGGTLYGRDLTARSVVTDSRTVFTGAGSMFVAISGRNHDGHAYVNELYGRGIRIFMIEKDIATDKYPDAAFILVAGSVGALQLLAADYRSRFKGVVAAVTGSNGKTVVKEWIASLTPPGVKLFRSPRSYNSQIGVPLSVLMLHGDEDMALFEAGISQPGEMEALEAVLRPEIGIYTNIGDAHQEGFGSQKDKAAEKAILFRNSRTIIYGGGYPDVLEAINKINPGADLIDYDNCRNAVESFGDRASRENAAAALAFCDAMGFDHPAALSRLALLEPVAMRLELKEGVGGAVIINDSYNSDINSLSIALDYLRSTAGGRPKTLILSDILQSGLEPAVLYSRVAEMVRQAGVQRVIGVGLQISRYGREFSVPVQLYPDTAAYLRSASTTGIAGQAVLIKGNRSSHFEQISHALSLKSHTTVLQVDLDAVVHNLNYLRACAGGTARIMAMVKASAYGHGAFEIATALAAEGVEYLAVAFADEGVALREKGVTTPIVVLNADSDSFDLMLANSLEPEIYDMNSFAEFVATVGRYGERAWPIHIKLDTGMHRLGFTEEELPALMEGLSLYGDRVKVATIFSHLASADLPADDAFTISQAERFDRMSDNIIEVLGYRPLRHLANSAASERFHATRYDMIRLGIGLYGIGTTPESPLRPVSRLITRIVQIKKLSPGETVGYAREGVVERDTVTATIPVGYADGLDRRLGCGNWSVMVAGRPAPTLGRISMDTCSIDITGIPAVVGDEVIIFGGSASGEKTGNSIAEMARRLDTIPYEVMTGISSRVKRIYIKE